VIDWSLFWMMDAWMERAVYPADTWLADELWELKSMLFWSAFGSSWNCG
jgi:hypothetical protein